MATPNHFAHQHKSTTTYLDINTDDHRDEKGALVHRVVIGLRSQETHAVEIGPGRALASRRGMFQAVAWRDSPECAVTVEHRGTGQRIDQSHTLIPLARGNRSGQIRWASIAGVIGGYRRVNRVRGFISRSAITAALVAATAVGGLTWTTNAVAAQPCPMGVVHDGSAVNEWCDQQYQKMATDCSKRFHDDSRRAAQCHQEAAQWYSDCLAGKHIRIASGPLVPGIRVR